MAEELHEVAASKEDMPFDTPSNDEPMPFEDAPAPNDDDIPAPSDDDMPFEDDEYSDDEYIDDGDEYVDGEDEDMPF